MNAEVRRKAAVWLGLVFLLGAATGGVFGYNMAHRSYASTNPSLKTDDQKRAHKLEVMTRQIGLDQDQVKKMDAIIAQAQAEGRVVREKSDTDMDAVRTKARNAMRAVLTPGQMPKFEEYVNGLDAERKKQKEMQGGH
jgi:Spy/CpxP family protein refolding chaperone